MEVEGSNYDRSMVVETILGRAMGRAGFKVSF